MRKNTRKSGEKAALARSTEGIDVLTELAALKAMTVPELQGNPGRTAYLAEIAEEEDAPLLMLSPPAS